MSKRALILVILTLLLFNSGFTHAAENDIVIYVEGERIETDYQNIDGRLFVPLRTITEHLGMEIEWLELDEHRMIVLNDREQAAEIIFYIDDDLAVINKAVFNKEVRDYRNDHQEIELETPAIIINGRTYVPLRFIAEVLDYNVQWNDINRTVSINSKPGPAEIYGDNLPGLFNYIRDGFYNYEKVIDINDFDIESLKEQHEDLELLLNSIDFLDPYLFFRKGYVITSNSRILGKDYYYYYYYDIMHDYYTQEEAIEALNNLKSKVEEIIDTHIHDTMTDKEKIRAIHDYLAANIVYDHDSINGIYQLPANAYRAIIDNKATCTGYSLAFKLFMDELNIDCGIVSGYIDGLDGGHSWNIVKLNDRWLHVDVTWDREPVHGKVIHDYFLLTDSEMLKNRTISQITKPISSY